MVIIPGPLLGLLPLHAACRFEGGERVYLGDEFIVEYAASWPLSRTKGYSSTDSSTATALVSLCDMSQPTPLAGLDQHLAAAALGTENAVAVGFRSCPNQSTWRELQEHLNDCTHLLISAHGLAHFNFPLKYSGVQLGTGTEHGNAQLLFELAEMGAPRKREGKANVGVLQLMQLPLNACQLAFLGSCEGALSSSTPTVDGSLSPAVALLLAGARQAVASMWLADDLASTMICRWVFESIANGKQAGHALQDAQAKLRCATKRSLAVVKGSTLDS